MTIFTANGVCGVCLSFCEGWGVGGWVKVRRQRNICKSLVASECEILMEFFISVTVGMMTLSLSSSLCLSLSLLSSSLSAPLFSSLSASYLSSLHFWWAWWNLRFIFKMAPRRNVCTHVREITAPVSGPCTRRLFHFHKLHLEGLETDVIVLDRQPPSDT